MKKLFNSILILLLFCSNIFSQFNINSPDIFSAQENLKTFNLQKEDSANHRSGSDMFLKKPNGIGLYSDQSTAGDDPEGYVLFIMLYLLNPVLSISDGKAVWGFTKEISMGFGDLGQYRTSVEYSFLDQPKYMNIFRAAFKYDILLKKKIKPSKNPVSTPVITVGGGYYTDFDKYGYFPELSFGFSYRDRNNLIYPSLKIRYTFINDSPDIGDLSLGLIYGFANPF